MSDPSELFNQQFTSVFTYENTSTLPDLGISPFNTIDMDDIHVDGVANYKLLANLQGRKAHGPDGIPAGLLKETAHSIIIWLHCLPIFTKPRSINTNFLMIGKQLWFLQFARKIHSRLLQTIDLYL